MFRKITSPRIILALTLFFTQIQTGAAFPIFAPGWFTIPNLLAQNPPITASSAPGAPTVTLLAPADGATVALNSSVFLAANASDPHGIDFVDFLRNGTPIGRAARSQGNVDHYSLVWIASQAGTHTIAVRATDLLGNATTSPEITITVGNSQPPTDTTPPEVQIVAPANNSTVNSGASVTIVATATDAQSSVDYVDFLRNGSVFARGTPVAGQSNNYSVTWTATGGQHSFTAHAADNSGNIAISAPVAVNVNSLPPADITAPAVEIVSPANGATVQLNSSVKLQAAATDSQGSVSSVDFLRNGSFLAGANPVSGQANQYSATWTATTLGQHTFAARATDDSGNTATSSSIVVNVVNPPPVDPPDNLLPTITITSPPSGELPFARLTISATASDSDGTIQKIEFFLNDRSIGSRTTSSSQANASLMWRPRSPGQYSLVAEATDNRGAVTASAPVQFTIQPPDGGPTQPIQITAVRFLPESYRPWHPFTVEVKVTSNSSTAYTLQETPPTGWRIIGVGHGGRYDSISGKVTFVSDKAGSTTFKYHAFPPRFASGTRTFSGLLTAGGQSFPVSGDSQIAAEPTRHDDDDDEQPERKCKIKKKKGGDITLQFKPRKGGRWVVEFCDSIARDSWKPLPNATFTITDERDFSIEDTEESAPLRFYRLRCLR